MKDEITYIGVATEGSRRIEGDEVGVRTFASPDGREGELRVPLAEYAMREQRLPTEDDKIAAEWFGNRARGLHRSTAPQSRSERISEYRRRDDDLRAELNAFLARDMERTRARTRFLERHLAKLQALDAAFDDILEPRPSDVDADAATGGPLLFPENLSYRLSASRAAVSPSARRAGSCLGSRCPFPAC